MSLVEGRGPKSALSIFKLVFDLPKVVWECIFEVANGAKLFSKLG